MSEGQGRLKKVTWNRVLKDEVTSTRQRESRRWREQHGQKPLWWKGQFEMKVICPEHEQQSRNRERTGWRVAGVRPQTAT